MAHISIEWLSGDPKGYVDWFPVADFAGHVSNAQRAHLVTGPRGGMYHARYRLDIGGKRARLDYAAFPELNDRHGMELGVMALDFEDSSRTSVVAVYWDGALLGKGDVTVALTNVLPTRRSSSELVAVDPRIVERTPRPEQPAFREELERAYGARCCGLISTPFWILANWPLTLAHDESTSHQKPGLGQSTTTCMLHDGSGGPRRAMRAAPLTREHSRTGGRCFELFTIWAPAKALLRPRWRAARPGYSSLTNRGDIMRTITIVGLVACLTACSSADGQTGPNGSTLSRSVISGTSAADGSASATLPAGAGSPTSLPMITVFALDEANNRWSVVSDGDGTFDGNGSWTVEAPASGPLVVRMRDLGSRAQGVAAQTDYQVVVIH